MRENRESPRKSEAPMVEKFRKVDTEGDKIKQLIMEMSSNPPEYDQEDLKSFDEDIRNAVKSNFDEIHIGLMGVVLFEHLSRITEILEKSEGEETEGTHSEDEMETSRRNRDQEISDAGVKERTADESEDPTFI